MRELEYTSLFASNIAVTYRDDEDYRSSAQSQRLAAAVPTAGQPFSTQTAYAAPPSPEQFQQMFPPPIYGGPTPVPVPSAGSPSAQAEEGAPAPPQPQETPSLNPAITSKQFRLFEGTVIETALVNRLDSSFAGPIITMVTNDVYSHDRQHVLIPAGTKCIGRTTSVENLGQSRMAVSFHRLIMPDGYSVNLDQFDGLNQLGDTGLKDKVNHHYFQIFGVSIALGFLGAISQNQFEAPFDNAGPQFARSAAQILDRFLNIAPTVTIREGHRVKVYLTQDLKLPAYDAHGIPWGI
jgi:type IV secretion system protein VirB10